MLFFIGAPSFFVRRSSTLLSEGWYNVTQLVSSVVIFFVRTYLISFSRRFKCYERETVVPLVTICVVLYVNYCLISAHSWNIVYLFRIEIKEKV